MDLDWNLVVQVAMVVITAAMAFATWRMAKATRASVEEMQQERRERVAPRVLVYFDVEPFHSLINLVVSNIGQGPAKDVRISLNRALMTSRGNDVAACTLLARGIPYMPPGQTHRLFVDVAPQYFKAGLPEQFEVTVSYLSADGSCQHKEMYTLDLSHWKDYAVARPQTKLEAQVERIAKAVEKISGEH
ncbi:MAG: hypothetical protein Kow0097_03470 [Candidatus Bipolaricaulota bacterium]